ncbi:VgrG protein [Chondromyces apiculatus DSM 436]|uniref:VgrG protein n=1 Tax=Chondromyces apiculatus DSM 436 TaxID=1192034 RepID=A0A017SSM5_9BACT|nr:VgrG protein [Chondromyces apiculatus DSM 436]
MARGAAQSAIHEGVGAARNALAGALGIDAAGGGGESGANAAGPAGDVAGVDATDREKGPGHSTAKIAGSHTEKVGSMKGLAAIKQIDTNVKGNKSIDVGAATIQLAIGNYAESAKGSKKESALGLVVLSKGGESEEVGGSKTTMVGGAIVDKLKGSHSIAAGGPATFIGAFHKMEAGGSITFKCGGSEVVIDGGGISITSPIVAILAPKIQLPKKVSEV